MIGMTVQGCCRDQHKMGQVIDQIKALGNNLDELREEIIALRNSYLDKEKETLTQNSKTNILQKMKKYMRRVTSVRSLRKGQKVDNNPKAYYLDPSLPIFLNYMFRMGKKGGLWQMPTRIKYFKTQGNQTDEEIQRNRFIANSSAVSMHAQSIENICYSDSYFARKRGNKRQTKMIFPKTESSLGGKCSEISCDLDVQVDNPIFSASTTEINIFPDSCIIKNYSQNAGVCLTNGKDKESATKSTQTNVEKFRRKAKNLNAHAKPPSVYFSKIKNAVITKKIVRNSSKSNFTVCGKMNSTKRHQFLNTEFCERCTCRKEKKDLLFSRGQETSMQNYFGDNDISILKKAGLMDGEKLYEKFSIEELPRSLSSSGSMHLEVNIFDSSDKTEEYSEEFSERRRPRTYLIHETSEKHNEDNRTRYEKSIVYVGQTSDLTLSSSSFSSKNIVSN